MGFEVGFETARAGSDALIGAGLIGKRFLLASGLGRRESEA